MTEKITFIGSICDICKQDGVMLDGGWIEHIINKHWDYATNKPEIYELLEKLYGYFFTNKIYDYGVHKI